MNTNLSEQQIELIQTGIWDEFSEHSDDAQISEDGDCVYVTFENEGVTEKYEVIFCGSYSVRFEKI